MNIEKFITDYLREHPNTEPRKAAEDIARIHNLTCISYIEMLIQATNKILD